MARQTKAQKIAKLIERLAIRYTIYGDALKIEGDNEKWLQAREDTLNAQIELEKLIGAEIDLIVKA